jgi:hypothetical protein
MASINVPDGVPVIGGDTLANLNFYLQVQQDACGTLAQRTLKKFCGRFMQRNGIAASAQQFADRRTKRRIVIDNMNDRRRFAHVAMVRTGSVTPVWEATAPRGSGNWPKGKRPGARSG